MGGEGKGEEIPIAWPSHTRACMNDQKSERNDLV